MNTPFKNCINDLFNTPTLDILNILEVSATTILYRLELSTTTILKMGGHVRLLIQGSKIPRSAVKIF